MITSNGQSLARVVIVKILSEAVMPAKQLSTKHGFWDFCAYAILLVCAVGTAVLLVPTVLIWIAIAFYNFSGEPTQLQPEQYFLHLTVWQLPSGGKVVSVDDTSTDWPSDGDVTLRANVPPEELGRMMALPGFRWTLWPPPKDVVASIDLPSFNATHYRLEKVLPRDQDWGHRGKIVMVNMSSGEICAYAWKR